MLLMFLRMLIMLGDSSVKTLILFILPDVLKLADPDFPESFKRFILADSPTTAKTEGHIHEHERIAHKQHSKNISHRF